MPQEAVSYKFYCMIEAIRILLYLGNMRKLLVWPWRAIQYLLVGPAINKCKECKERKERGERRQCEKCEKEHNPLIRTQIDSKNNEEPIKEPIEPSIIVTRTKKLINCNLQDYERHFNLAAATLISAESWRDPKFSPEMWKADEAASDRIRYRIMTQEEYKSFEEDQGSILEMLWRQPWAMKQLMLLCGLGSMIQGWDEAAINGAQVYFKTAYNFSPNDPRIGFINGAPYACCFISCWLSWPLNNYWGRRPTIFLSALCCVGFALGQSFANDWRTMLALRIFLGLGIGPKSATIPVYASELAPANLRGALVMLWQLFTALGIMFGYLSVVWFANGGDGYIASLQEYACSAEENNDLLSLGCSLNWRLMIGSPMVAPILLCLYIFLQPESPRWLIAKAQRKERANKCLSPNESITSDLGPVFYSLVRLRGGNKLKAARDMIIIDVLLWTQKDEAELKRLKHTNTQNIGSAEESNAQDARLASGTERTNGKPRLLEESDIRSAWEQLKTLYSKRRNRNALIASIIVMFLQQYCGINILIYYSTLVLSETTDNGIPSLYPNSVVPRFIVLSSIVGGMNFVCGLPAIFLIDRRGRRTLLLRTFPLLGIFAALVAIGNADALSHSQAREPLTLAGMYLFVIFYSPGEGPVPFVYASESFPQDVRDLGMSLVTSINWILNFAAAVSFPSMSDASHMSLSGAFAFYSVMCFVGFVLVFLFVPETCQKELERLDEVFDQSLLDFAANNLKKFANNLRELWRSIHQQRNKMLGRRPLRREESTFSTNSQGENTHMRRSSELQQILRQQGPEEVQVRETSPVRTT